MIVCPGLSARPGEQAAEHDAVCPRRQGLGDVAGVADAAIGDDRHAAVGDPLSGLVDRRDLRHADAGDDPRRADRPGPDADLDRVRPGIDQGLRPFRRGHVAGDHVDLEPLLQFRRTVSITLRRMAVSRIDHQHIHARPDQRFGPLVVVDADRRPDAQATARVLAGVGESW